MTRAERFIGVDVSAKRGCAIAALDERRRLCAAKWVAGKATKVAAAIRALGDGADRLVIGIDAPRRFLSRERQWYWDSRVGWRPRLPTHKGWGRHCEVVIKALGLANPQWTPLVDAVPERMEWMRLGVQLFAELKGSEDVYEVFPSASYAQLDKRDEPVVRLSFRRFAAGPKDMLDAVVAAVTVAEYAAGRRMEVGGGDGLGSIILPRSIGDCPSELLRWPGESG